MSESVGEAMKSPVNSDRLKRHVVWVCAGCDECEPLDGAPPSRFPCRDSPSADGAVVVLAEEHEAEVERLRKLCEMVDAHYSGSLDYQPAYVRAIREALNESPACGESGHVICGKCA